MPTSLSPLAPVCASVKSCSGSQPRPAPVTTFCSFSLAVDQVQLPHAEVLLHAACQDKVVTCELTPLNQAGEEANSPEVAYFISTVQVSGGGFSVSMVIKTLGGTEKGAPLHPQLNLPLTPRGTMLASGEEALVCTGFHLSPPSGAWLLPLPT